MIVFMRESSNNTLAATFGRRLAELRQQHQLTQAELAKHLGVSKSMITYYETWAKNPTLEAVQKVANYFQVPPETLIVTDQTEEPQKSPPTKLEILMNKVERLSAQKQRMVISGLEGMLNAQ